MLKIILAGNYNLDVLVNTSMKRNIIKKGINMKFLPYKCKYVFTQIIQCISKLLKNDADW
jgi:hypothetical protein